jgi:DNA-binding transcriptional MerR regulator
LGDLRNTRQALNKIMIKNTFTIEEVGEIAGVNSFTLRNWEERYSLFTPGRDSNGRRVFNEDDTMRAVVAAELTKRHYKISRVATDLQHAADPNLVLLNAVEGDSFVNIRNEALDGLLRFDLDLFLTNYMHLVGNYGAEFMADHFFYPIYRELEELKVLNQISPFQFRFAQHQLATRIMRLSGVLKSPRSRESSGKVLITGFLENEFEDSLLILILVLERNGWEVIYAGPRMTMADVESGIKATGASMVLFVGNNLTLEQYDAHAKVFPELKVPVIVGGKLALRLHLEGRKNTSQLEFSKLRPGPLARILKYKLTNDSAI